MELKVRIPLGKEYEGRQIYILDQDLSRDVLGKNITINRGFETDLVSLPLPLRLFLSPTGKWALGAIYHDFLYNTQYTDRKFADLVFYEIMKDSNVAKWKRVGAYLAVRIFGRGGKNIEKFRKYGNVRNLSA